MARIQTGKGYTMTATHRGRVGRVLRWLVGLALLGAVAALAIWKRSSFLSREKESTELVFSVKRGPLVISVSEGGTIKPRERTVIKSELEGRNTILFLVPEGQHVKKGQLLIELDATKMVDNRVDQEMRVGNAEASFIQARENLEVVKNKAKADLEKADLALRFSREDLVKYKEGDFPNKLMAAESSITLAEEELQRATDTLEWSRRLHEEKYINDTEFQADQLVANKAKLKLKLAKSDLNLLKDYEYKRQVDKLQSDVNQAEMALEREKRKGQADVLQAEALLRARESEFKRQKERLAKIDEQIAKAKIYAPTDGVVVYATSTQFSWRGNIEPLAEGQEVRERQELIHLPVANTFMAAVKIHETSLKKIYVGLPVRLTVDALPGHTFTGKISKIAPLPDPQSMFMNPDLKLYNTEIDIDGGGDVLRTGMNCQAEIIVASYDDVLYAPVQCVVRVGGKPTVYVKKGDVVTPREVKIGLDNNTMVHILEGVKEGEELLLTPPLGSSSAANLSDSMGDMVIPPRPKVAAPARPKVAARGGGAPAGAPGRPGAGGRPTPEQMKAMRKRFESMTPEQREAMRKKWAGRRRRQNGGEGQ